MYYLLTVVVLLLGTILDRESFILVSGFFAIAGSIELYAIHKFKK